VCSLRDHVDPDEEVMQRLHIDTRYIRLGKPRNWKKEELPDNSNYDEWGIKWHKPATSLYWDPVEAPLRNAESPKDVELLKTCPDPLDPGRTEGLNQKAKELSKTGYAIVADLPVLGVFDTSWMLRGMQDLFMDMLTNKSLAHAIMDKVTDHHIKLFGSLAETVGEYIDVIMLCDDLGSQNNMLISPELYREFIKPREKKVFDTIKSKTKAKIFFHSCGAVSEIIKDLIEIGVDILNPIQPLARGMDPEALKKKYGKDICFWGAVDTQQVLAFGSEKDVEEEVIKRIRQLSDGGGYVLAPSHNIQPGVSAENVCALYDSGYKHGNY